MMDKQTIRAERRKFLGIAAAAINDVITEEKSDYKGAGSLKMWEKFSPEWFNCYHYKIAKRFAERALDDLAKAQKENRT